MNRVLGVHLPSSRGLRYVVISARGLGVNAVQTFLGPTQSWLPYKFTPSSINEFKKLSYGLVFYVQFPHILNPSESSLSSSCSLRLIMLSSAFRYLELAMELGARSVIFRPGYLSPSSPSLSQARDSLLSFLHQLLSQHLSPRIFLEVDAGSSNGSRIGSIEFLSSLVDDLGREVNICLNIPSMISRGVDLLEPDILDSITTLFGSKIGLVYLPPLSSPLSLNLAIKLLLKYPCILERKSLVSYEQDLLSLSPFLP